MSFKSTLLIAAAAVSFASMTLADDMAKILVMDPYARSSTSKSVSGAAFMTLMNHSDQDDRLISAHSDAAEKVELHTHLEDANGVMSMVEIEGGIVIPAGEAHKMMRGGDHVMFLGLKDSMTQGDIIEVTLTFEKAGEVIVEVPVDLTRKPGAGAMQHKHNTDG